LIAVEQKLLFPILTRPSLQEDESIFLFDPPSLKHNGKGGDGWTCGVHELS